MSLHVYMGRKMRQVRKMIELSSVSGLQVVFGRGRTSMLRLRNLADFKFVKFSCHKTVAMLPKMDLGANNSIRSLNMLFACVELLQEARSPNRGERSFSFWPPGFVVVARQCSGSEILRNSFNVVTKLS